MSGFSKGGGMNRPDISAEREASLSGKCVDEILAIRQDLENTKGEYRHDKVWDYYVKIISITLTDAAISLRMPPDGMTMMVRKGWVPAFKHRNRWRIWLVDFEAMMKSDFVQMFDPDTLGTRR